MACRSVIAVYPLNPIAAEREDKKIKLLFRDVPINFVDMEPKRMEVWSKGFLEGGRR
jgi:hypothetical protein